MRKIVFISLMIFLSFTIAKSQNIGINIGGGMANMKQHTNSTTLDNAFNNSIKSISTYRGGVSFESVLVEKKFYLEFSINGQGRGFQSEDKKSGYKLFYADIPLDLKYKFQLEETQLYNLFVTAGPYIGMGIAGLSKNIANDNDVVFGKETFDDFTPVDYGLNLGVGAGLNKFQIAYKFGFGLANVSPAFSKIDNSKLSTVAHMFTVGYYFTTD